jgi:histone H3/H4
MAKPPKRAPKRAPKKPRTNRAAQVGKGVTVEYSVGTKKTNPEFVTCPTRRKHLVQAIGNDFKLQMRYTADTVDATFTYMEHMGAEVMEKAVHAGMHRKRKTTNDRDVNLVRRIMKL